MAVPDGPRTPAAGPRRASAPVTPIARLVDGGPTPDGAAVVLHCKMPDGTSVRLLLARETAAHMIDALQQLIGAADGLRRAQGGADGPGGPSAHGAGKAPSDGL